MRSSLVGIMLSLSAVLAGSALAESRAQNPCTPFAAACDCPRQVRNCPPVCQIEPFIVPCTGT
jgi:hypothetical protein